LRRHTFPRILGRVEWIYWYTDDDGVVYAGRSIDPDRRENEHWSKSWWRTGGQQWHRRCIPTGLDPATIEQMAITRLRPRVNQRRACANGSNLAHLIRVPLGDIDAWIAAWNELHAAHLRWAAENLPLA
jgi:hypothetical protein